MQDIIRLLPDSIANQIAAGEVVQRPASVVKELVENSLDAGADDIKVIIRDAGKQLIQIIDNGKGMSPTDARMSIERHATSKISSADDLFALKTMGFRGEALASIAAVAQVEIKTRQKELELGTTLLVEGSTIKKQEPESCPVGTSVSVRNLFFNIPARRNFLKGNPVELRHIIDEFIHLSLSHPAVAFMLVHGDEVIYDLQPSKIGQRIVALFGKTYQQQLASCDEEAGAVRVSGFVGRPELARRTRSEQFLFVNNRYFRSNYLHHAVMSGFEGLLPDGSFPFYALFLDVDPKQIDVNVHPAKTEVKFIDERTVYTVIRVAVRRALGLHQITPALDFSANINLDQQLSGGQVQSKAAFFGEHQFRVQKSNADWEKLFGGIPQHTAAQPTQQELPGLPEQQAVRASDRIRFQFQDQFIIREVSNGLMVIDQQAAHERVLFDRFLSRMKSGSGNAQQMLFPMTLDFSPADFSLMVGMIPEFEKLGFKVEVFGKATLLFSAAPAETASREKEIIEGLLEQFKVNVEVLDLPVQENLARTLAKRAAVKRGQRLGMEEVDALISGLFSSNNPGFTPDGRPTFFIFESNRMAEFFNQ
ncbi:MAG: DNA mismatch repair endonuclease MutL [Bacteroidetes bacterium]|nr:DNA mismatch repair endonuclease MutL [Bacteroidota bacterium]